MIYLFSCVKENCCHKKVNVVKLLSSTSVEEDRKTFSDKVENRKDYLHFEDKMLLRKLEIKDFVAKEYHNCKRSSTRKIHDSLKYMCHDLSEEAIQNLLNHDRSLTQRNTNFSNKSILTTH